MARADINATTLEVQSDPGAVLFSVVHGEHIEFPVNLTFLDNATSGYSYEAVLVEASNSGNGVKPDTVAASPVTVALAVTVPSYRGNWSSGTAYHRYDTCVYNGVVYILRVMALSRVSSTPPDADPAWAVHSLNRIFVQMSASPTLVAALHTQPTPANPVYMFFELRVSELTVDAVQNFRLQPKTWKPVRGMVEIHFSPTEMVA